MADNNNDFSQYKELILTEIKTLKDEFKQFKDTTTTHVNDIKVTLAVLNTKLMVASAITSTVVGAVISIISKKFM